MGYGHNTINWKHFSSILTNFTLHVVIIIVSTSAVYISGSVLLTNSAAGQCSLVTCTRQMLEHHGGEPSLYSVSM